jgi:hypothetical protein
MRRTILILFVVGFAIPLLAQPSIRIKARSAADLYAEQRRVVGSWCRHDFEGFRLSVADWARFRSLTTFKENPDFSSVMIVSRFDVQPRDSASWNMEVKYVVLGRYDRGSGYTASPGSDTVTFHTKDIDDNIVIVDLDPSSPHVSKRVAIEWMRQELGKTTSDLEKAHLREALKVLDPTPAVAPAPTR